MSDRRVRYREANGRDAQSIYSSQGDAITQSLFLERQKRCRIQIVEGPNDELIDRETFEHEHLRSSRQRSKRVDAVVSF
jgi:hypothetical protein